MKRGRERERRTELLTAELNTTPAISITPQRLWQKSQFIFLLFTFLLLSFAVAVFYYLYSTGIGEFLCSFLAHRLFTRPAGTVPVSVYVCMCVCVYVLCCICVNLLCCVYMWMLCAVCMCECCVLCLATSSYSIAALRSNLTYNVHSYIRISWNGLMMIFRIPSWSPCRAG